MGWKLMENVQSVMYGGDMEHATSTWSLLVQPDSRPNDTFKGQLCPLWDNETNSKIINVMKCY